MDNITLKDMTDLVNSGSNLALVACAWFIHKSESRLTACEKILTSVSMSVGELVELLSRHKR